MKKFRGSALVAGAAAFALTISGCAAPEELTPTPSATQAPAEPEWYEQLEPQLTVAWNDIVEHFNGNTAAGNNVADSLTAYLTSAGFSYYNNEPALVMNTDFGSYEIVVDNPLTVKYTINDLSLIHI